MMRNNAAFNGTPSCMEGEVAQFEKLVRGTSKQLGLATTPAWFVLDFPKRQKEIGVLDRERRVLITRRATKVELQEFTLIA